MGCSCQRDRREYLSHGFCISEVSVYLSFTLIAFLEGTTAQAHEAGKGPPSEDLHGHAYIQLNEELMHVEPVIP